MLSKAKHLWLCGVRATGKASEILRFAQNDKDYRLPITIAGRTFRLVRSLKGIGNKTTSFREQFIEDIVIRIVPSPKKSFFRHSQPGATLGISFDRDKNARFSRQRQRLLQDQLSVIVKRFDRRAHDRVQFPICDLQVHRILPGSLRRADFHAFAFQTCAQFARKFDGARRIAMDTDRFATHLDILAFD
jgi:hypothetical protein